MSSSTQRLFSLLLVAICFYSSSGSCPDCRGDLTSVFSQVNITLTSYTTTCPLYDTFRTCYDNKPEECTTPGPDDVINTIFNYTCGEGFKKIERTRECWIRGDVIAAVRGCSVHLSPTNPDDKCSTYTNYSDCLNSTMLDLCSQEASEVMTEFVTVTTRAERQRFGCPDPVIVRPPLNIRCYECHSGATGWINPHCFVNGTIQAEYVGYALCADSCFAKTDKWTRGVVYRGCAHNFLPQEYPRPLPRFGCRNIKGETWCFCDGPSCNNMPMTEHLDSTS